MPLFMAKFREEYLVKKIGGSEQTKHHLNDLGFVPGAKVLVISVMCGNLIVQVKYSRIALGRDLAGKIIV